MTTMDASGPARFAPRPTGIDWTRQGDRWALALMLVAAALTGPIGYAGQLGYAALVGLAGIACLPFLAKDRPPAWGFAPLVLLVLWAAVATSWSPSVPPHPDFHRYKTLEGLVGLKLLFEAALFAAFVVGMQRLPANWSDRIMATLAVGLVVIAILMSIDALTDQGVYKALRLSVRAEGPASLIRPKAARGCYTVALLFWPASLWMWRKRWFVPALIMGAAFLVAAVGMTVDTPILAVVLGGFAMAAVRRFGPRAVVVLAAATVIYFALAPLAIQLFGRYLPTISSHFVVGKASWGARADAWRFAAAMTTHQPFIGFGTDASRMFPQIPMHPHDAAIQVWFELGAVGVVLVCLFWVWLWSAVLRVSTRSQTTAGVLAAVAVAYLTIGGSSFGVWQEWWLALGALAFVVAQVFDRSAGDFEPGADEGLTPLQPL